MKQINNKEDIIQLIKDDPWMMNILTIVRSINLPDCWVCAGFVRSKIWDVLHGFNQRTPLKDVDVIYFDNINISQREEKRIDKILNHMNPDIPWEVKNQARMHIANNISPYSSSEDAISKFPETATALGVKLDETDQIILTAPCGIEDVIDLNVKPTPFFQQTRERAKIYQERLVTKKWKDTWYKLKIHHI